MKILQKASNLVHRHVVDNNYMSCIDRVLFLSCLYNLPINLLHTSVTPFLNNITSLMLVPAWHSPANSFCHAPHLYCSIGDTEGQEKTLSPPTITSSRDRLYYYIALCTSYFLYPKHGSREPLDSTIMIVISANVTDLHLPVSSSYVYGLAASGLQKRWPLSFRVL